MCRLKVAMTAAVEAFGYFLGDIAKNIYAQFNCWCNKSKDREFCGETLNE